MSEFMWGAATGAVLSPFAWEGIKWCWRKYTALLAKK